MGRQPDVTPPSKKLMPSGIQALKYSVLKDYHFSFSMEETEGPQRLSEREGVEKAHANSETTARAHSQPINSDLTEVLGQEGV